VPYACERCSSLEGEGVLKGAIQLQVPGSAEQENQQRVALKKYLKGNFCNKRCQVLLRELQVLMIFINRFVVRILR